MKIHGLAGQPQIQQNRVRQGCTLSPTLFGIFFDGLQDHLDSYAPHAGLQIDSGRWVSSLIYADDVALMSWTSPGIQGLLGSMPVFCEGLVITISPARTEIVIFNRSCSDVWHSGQQALSLRVSIRWHDLS